MHRKRSLSARSIRSRLGQGELRSVLPLAEQEVGCDHLTPGVSMAAKVPEKEACRHYARVAEGAPHLRMTLILAAVAAFTALSAWWAGPVHAPVASGPDQPQRGLEGATEEA